jgi:hypothetical protein
MTETGGGAGILAPPPVLDFDHSDFGFVSDFVLRISGAKLVGAY